MVQTQVNQVNNLTNSFSVIKDAMNSIPPVLVDDNAKAPTLQLPQLDLWLQQNDCTTAENKDLCYTQTRLMLVKQTYQFDQVNDQLYAAKKVISQLKTTLNSVVDVNQQASKKFNDLYKSK